MFLFPLAACCFHSAVSPVPLQSPLCSHLALGSSGLTRTLFQVFSKLLYPIVRGAALCVLKYMLLTFQHSHEAFHLVSPASCSGL